MRLHEAIEKAENGEKVKRERWEDYLYIQNNTVLRCGETHECWQPVLQDFTADDWQIIKAKKEPVSAEEWVENQRAITSTEDAYCSVAHLKHWCSIAFRAGEANRDLIYAELMEMVKEYLWKVDFPLQRQERIAISNKIKQIEKGKHAKVQ
jgi:sarcosine oxidase delta subunit